MARKCTNNLRVVLVHIPNSAHVRPWSKKWSKKPNLKSWDRAWLFWFWAQNFFGGLTQKSAMISIYKIHNYIDSESFMEKCSPGVGIFGNHHLGKWNFEIWPFLWYFWRLKWSICVQLTSNLVYPSISMQIRGKTNWNTISQKMWQKWPIFGPK